MAPFRGQAGRALRRAGPPLGDLERAEHLRFLETEQAQRGRLREARAHDGAGDPPAGAQGRDRRRGAGRHADGLPGGLPGGRPGRPGGSCFVSPVSPGARGRLRGRVEEVPRDGRRAQQASQALAGRERLSLQGRPRERRGHVEARLERDPAGQVAPATHPHRSAPGAGADQLLPHGRPGGLPRRDELQGPVARHGVHAQAGLLRLPVPLRAVRRGDEEHRPPSGAGRPGAGAVAGRGFRARRPGDGHLVVSGQPAERLDAAKDHREDLAAGAGQARRARADRPDERPGFSV